MTRSMVETILGAVVLIGAAWFLVFSYHAGHSGSSGEGFHIYADFAGIGGLKAGDAVEISGVKVGSVESVELVSDSYLARVRMNLKQGMKLPTDTAALISSESLLGGRYLSLEPGAEELMLKDGGKIQYTQAPQNLEELLGKFIFSMSGAKKEDDKSGNASSPAAPAPAVENKEEKKTDAAAPSAPEAPAAAPSVPAAPAPPEPSSGPAPDAAPHP